jgi:hypothetical protein
MAAARTFHLALDLMAYVTDHQSLACKILYRRYITDISIDIVACTPVARQRSRKNQPLPSNGFANKHVSKKTTAQQ